MEDFGRPSNPIPTLIARRHIARANMGSLRRVNLARRSHTQRQKHTILQSGSPTSCITSHADPWPVLHVDEGAERLPGSHQNNCETQPTEHRHALSEQRALRLCWSRTLAWTPQGPKMRNPSDTMPLRNLEAPNRKFSPWGVHKRLARSEPSRPMRPSLFAEDRSQACISIPSGLLAGQCWTRCCLDRF